MSSARGVPAGIGAVDFSTGDDSPVSTDSAHSSPTTSSSRRSAGTTAPSRSDTTSPGTRSLTSTVCGRPPRSTVAQWCTWECSVSAARSARYSLTNPRPTDSATMAPITRALLCSPTPKDTAAATTSRPSRGERSWWPSTAHGRARCEATALSPHRARRRAASPSDSPSAAVTRWSSSTSAVYRREAATTALGSGVGATTGGAAAVTVYGARR